MKYRVLGRTGLRVSEIGFGCGNVSGLMVRAPLEERVSAVVRATELGINYFDTAPAYGNGQSETNLGEVLGLTKSQVSVATKVGLSQDDVKDIRGVVRRSVETSLKRLRRDYVDVLQLHTAVSKSDSDSSRNLSVRYVLDKNGIADAFDAVRSQGMARFLGFTGLGDTEALHQIAESERFDVIQVYYNLLNPSAGLAVPDNFGSQNFRQLIDKAAQHNLGIVVIRVLAGGALGGTAARGGYAASGVGRALVPGSDYQNDESRAGQLDFLLGGDITNLSQAGIRFALDHPNVSTVLVGFSSLEQIENAAACSECGPFSRSALEHLRKLWDTDFHGKSG